MEQVETCSTLIVFSLEIIFVHPIMCKYSSFHSGDKHQFWGSWERSTKGNCENNNEVGRIFSPALRKLRSSWNCVQLKFWYLKTVCSEKLIFIFSPQMPVLSHPGSIMTVIVLHFWKTSPPFLAVFAVDISALSHSLTISLSQPLPLRSAPSAGMKRKWRTRAAAR